MSPAPQWRCCHLQHYHYSMQCYGSVTSPPLVFLHGFLGSCRDFEAIMVALSPQFYCIGIDLPGHGRTQVFGDQQCYGMEAIALSLSQVFDHLALGPMHLLGYSMGGRVALYLAIYYPQYFRSLILESASPGLATVAERRDRLKHDAAIAHRLETEDFPQFLDWWYSLPLFKALRSHGSYPKMLQRRRDNDPLELARSLRALGLGAQPSLWPQLSTLQLATMLLVGAQDQKFIEIGDQVQRKNKTVVLQSIEQCGHTPHLENAQVFTERVQQFCGSKVS